MSDKRPPDAAESRAAKRYWTLQFIRLAGILMAMAGGLMVAGRTQGDGPLGPVLFIGGALLFFVVPILLAKKWKREQP
ncbi:hypothetical protein [Alteriqipengyuania sp. 357]